MNLSDIELRSLGALVEKERTTPEQYPLTTNSLVLACNQKSNREPVTSFTSFEVEVSGLPATSNLNPGRCRPLPCVRRGA